MQCYTKTHILFVPLSPLTHNSLVLLLCSAKHLQLHGRLKARNLLQSLLYKCMSRLPSRKVDAQSEPRGIKIRQQSKKSQGSNDTNWPQKHLQGWHRCCGRPAYHEHCNTQIFKPGAVKHASQHAYLGALQEGEGAVPQEVQVVVVTECYHIQDI